MTVVVGIIDALKRTRLYVACGLITVTSAGACIKSTNHVNSQNASDLNYSDQSEDVQRLSEKGMWDAVLESVLPDGNAVGLTTPDDAVAVVEVSVSPTASLEGVTVIEAPNLSVAASVKQAVSKWRFVVLRSGGKPVPYVGKFTFYFVHESGRLHVYHGVNGPVVSLTAHAARGVQQQ